MAPVDPRRWCHCSQGAAQYKEKIKGAEIYLDDRVQELRAEGLENVVATAIQGDAADEIIDLACRTEKNLIAMTTHGRSGAGRSAASPRKPSSIRAIPCS